MHGSRPITQAADMEAVDALPYMLKKKGDVEMSWGLCWAGPRGRKAGQLGGLWGRKCTWDGCWLLLSSSSYDKASLLFLLNVVETKKRKKREVNREIERREERVLKIIFKLYFEFKIVCSNIHPNLIWGFWLK